MFTTVCTASLCTGLPKVFDHKRFDVSCRTKLLCVFGFLQSKMSEVTGSDSLGAKYKTVDDMWKKELTGDVDDKSTGWYGKAIAYWEKQETTVNGVLGGMEHVHPADVKETKEVLCSFDKLGRKRALDCGAGIGRIAKNVFETLGFEKIDLVEPIEAMMAQAKKDLNPETLGEMYVTSMQKMIGKLEHNYDVILIQWVAIYFTDDDFAAILAECKKHLNLNGIVFFKENMVKDNVFLVDKDDSSLTRCEKHYRAIFEAGGVTVVKEGFQKEWPKDLYPVKYWCLQ